MENYTYAPYGTSGSGTYGEYYSDFTETLLAPLKSYVFDLVINVPCPDKSKVYMIGDYGASDGAASMTFMRELLLVLKDKHGPEIEFTVIYEDLAVNDFNSLFKRLSGLIAQPPSYLQDVKNVYALASGTSFYKQCVPSDSMNIIFCLTAAHWMSRRPTVYRKSVSGVIDASEEEKKLLRIQAKSDWENFLFLRSRELKFGGLLVAWVATKQSAKQNKREMLSCETIVKMLNSNWKSFRDSGKITEDEFLNTNIGHNLFTIDELKAPFLETSSRVAKAGLQLVKAETFFYSTSAYLTWRRKIDQNGVDDREDFARNYVLSHRCWSNNTFMSGLLDTRTTVEKEAIVDELYQQVQTDIKTYDPEVLRDDIIMTAVIAQKLHPHFNTANDTAEQFVEIRSCDINLRREDDIFRKVQRFQTG